jgi:hypothetical protein
VALNGVSLRIVGGTAAGLLALFTALPALAANVVTVTPSDPQGWSTADTRTGGAVSFVSDPTSPAPPGALQLTTDATTTAKAQYLHAAATPLASITSLSYQTKQVSASFPQGDPSYQLIVNLNGSSGFTTHVYEPYQNTSQGPVVPNVWQRWDVSAGRFWSTRDGTCANGNVVGTHGGPASYTLADIKGLCPDAVAIGFGVNIGTNNPSWSVETDLVEFNGTFYDFEQDSTGGIGGGCTGVCPPSPGATPELDSLLLFGSGLSGLGGYAIMRLRARRRQ